MKGLILLLLCSLPLLTQARELVFDDPEVQARYEEIIDEVRCLKCQNQTIKDSSAFLASDLRREIQRLIREGKTNDEIYDFLVERYGEFTLYRPRMSGKTLVLWIAPVALLLVGGAVIFSVLRRRAALPLDEDPREQV